MAASKSGQCNAPSLDQIQLDILHMVRLHHRSSSNQHIDTQVNSNDIQQYLQLSLSNLYSRGYLPSSHQSSFDDGYCNTDESMTIDPPLDELNLDFNLLNTKLSSYHIYKYSRRERDRFYRRRKLAMIKKHHSSMTKPRCQATLSSIFHQRHFLIDIPTKIRSRQRLNSHSTHLYPLLLDSHFHLLVQLPVQTILTRYYPYMQSSFHLIHSIASQEFQMLVQNYDHQHQLSYTSFSLLNVLRQTMFDSTRNLKRSYFQSFDHHQHDDEHEQELSANHESFIPPLKIRRYDHASYEIEKRSTSSSSSSSSSGISVTQIHHAQQQQQQQYEDRRRSETRSKKFLTPMSDHPMNNNCLSTHNHLPRMTCHELEKREMSDLTVGSPLLHDLSLHDRHHSNDRNSTEPLLSHVGEPPKARKSTSPNPIREQTNESVPKYQSVVLNDGARIRIVNCSNDNSKTSSVRHSNSTSTAKRLSNSIDESGVSKTTRIRARKVSSTHSKSSEISDVSPPYEAQSVLMSTSDLSAGWITHSVFYRCHACLHEEFFVVLSRECMSLHLSSKHGNMEENFKQRSSNFLNDQGRALKIFQHYLKRQQPWSEQEIDQIFQLSNIHARSNGSSEPCLSSS